MFYICLCIIIILVISVALSFYTQSKRKSKSELGKLPYPHIRMVASLPCECGENGMCVPCMARDAEGMLRVLNNKPPPGVK